MATSKGVWFDTQTQKVVTSQPEQGLQLVAPGVEATPDDEARVEAYKAGGNAEPQTVTTKTGK